MVNKNRRWKKSSPFVYIIKSYNIKFNRRARIQTLSSTTLVTLGIR